MSLLLWYRDEGAVENRAYGVRLMSLLLIAVGNRAYRGRFYVCPAKKKENMTCDLFTL